MSETLYPATPRNAGDPAFDFTLMGTDGETYATQPARAHALTLIALFKTGCGTCKYALPYLQRFHAQYALPSEGKFQIWGVSQDDQAATEAFAAQYGGATFPLLLDSALQVSGHYGITNVPNLYLLGAGDAIESALVGHFSRDGYNALAQRIAAATGVPYTPIVRPEDDAPAIKPG